MGKRKGKALKKNHAVDDTETPEVLNAPHSFVIHRGLPFPNITFLTRDFRRMMEPFTAASLRERRKNRIKDFVSLSGMFHVSHMVIFNKTANQLSFKAARLPKGPTLTFRIHQFTLARDVLASMKKQYFNDTAFKHSPLVRKFNFFMIKQNTHEIRCNVAGDFEQLYRRRKSLEIDGAHVPKHVPDNQFGDGEFVDD